VEQFELFIDTIAPNGDLIYYCGDEHLKVITAAKEEADLTMTAYGTHKHRITDGITYLIDGDKEYALQVFGRHNLQNLNAALHVCVACGISKEGFYASIGSFTGAARRLELLIRTDTSVVYKDFAHSPSKLKATTEALKEQYPDRELIACMELHTFSSLNKEFLAQYEGSMSKADEAFVYFDPAVVQQKRLEAITKGEIALAFASTNVTVFDDMDKLLAGLKKLSWVNKNLLLMTSGNFKGLDMLSFAREITS
jgi:UDP-N-acetylmuramate: L-alanyl-gamma-D-glutamyl-meso-diaminopimelate ligase